MEPDITIPMIKVYKVYTAILTQTGTDAPVATVLNNSIKGVIGYTYNGTGWYEINVDSNMPQSKTWLNITFQGDVDIQYAKLKWESVNKINIYTGEPGIGAGNDILTTDHPAYIEIRIYS